MKSPLICDKRDFKWNLLANIVKIFDSRRAHQEMAKKGIKPVNKSVNMLKILNLAIFFSADISYVLKELKRRRELRDFTGINTVRTEYDLIRFISGLSDEQFIEMVLKFLNVICKP
jgi:hypothetical protein